MENIQIREGNAVPFITIRTVTKCKKVQIRIYLLKRLVSLYPGVMKTFCKNVAASAIFYGVICFEQVGWKTYPGDPTSVLGSLFHLLVRSGRNRLSC